MDTLRQAVRLVKDVIHDPKLIYLKPVLAVLLLDNKATLGVEVLLL